MSIIFSLAVKTATIDEKEKSLCNHQCIASDTGRWKSLFFVIIDNGPTSSLMLIVFVLLKYYYITTIPIVQLHIIYTYEFSVYARTLFCQLSIIQLLPLKIQRKQDGLCIQLTWSTFFEKLENNFFRKISIKNVNFKCLPCKNICNLSM